MTSTRRTIMIVDDDADVALALARAVRSMGDHRVLVAYTGLDALDMLRNHEVDVLLSDIDMPGMDGVTLACHARDEGLAPLRLLLTGNARLDTALRAVNRGEVYRYLTKPWNAADLVRTLEDALRRLSEYSRLGSADRAAQRMRAAMDALELEFPGITQVGRDDGRYVLDEKRLEQATELLVGSTLHLLLSERLKGL